MLTLYSKLYQNKIKELESKHLPKIIFYFLLDKVSSLQKERKAQTYDSNIEIDELSKK